MSFPKCCTTTEPSDRLLTRYCFWAKLTVPQYHSAYITKQGEHMIIISITVKPLYNYIYKEYELY